MKHGPFVNCSKCRFPIDSGSFCMCKGQPGEGVLTPCTCKECRK